MENRGALPICPNVSPALHANLRRSTRACALIASSLRKPTGAHMPSQLPVGHKCPAGSRTGSPQILPHWEAVGVPCQQPLRQNCQHSCSNCFSIGNLLDSKGANDIMALQGTKMSGITMGAGSPQYTPGRKYYPVTAMFLSSITARSLITTITNYTIDMEAQIFKIAQLTITRTWTIYLYFIKIMTYWMTSV